MKISLSCKILKGSEVFLGTSKTFVNTRQGDSRATCLSIDPGDGFVILLLFLFFFFVGLDLRCSIWTFLVAANGGYSLVVVLRFLVVLAALVVAHGLKLPQHVESSGPVTKPISPTLVAAS